MKRILNRKGLTSSQKSAADADGDGEITAQDARTILRSAIGLD